MKLYSIRPHYAQHQIFTTFPTASVYYDFVHNLGIVEETKFLNLKYNKPYEKILVVVMQAQIKEIITKGNQVLIKVEPKRAGLEILTIYTNNIKPINSIKTILFQLATINGELDYALIKIP